MSIYHGITNDEMRRGFVEAGVDPDRADLFQRAILKFCLELDQRGVRAAIDIGYRANGHQDAGDGTVHLLALLPQENNSAANRQSRAEIVRAERAVGMSYSSLPISFHTVFGRKHPGASSEDIFARTAPVGTHPLGRIKTMY